jgi:hypothetical protein
LLSCVATTEAGPSITELNIQFINEIPEKCLNSLPKQQQQEQQGCYSLYATDASAICTI